MSSFLTNHGVVVALVCAGCAVVYGVVTARSLLALSPGNERMQGISGAVQQGARAYLNRQYTTIALVGVVLFVALIFIQNIAVAVRLRDRRRAVGLGRLHRHERLGARELARRRGRPRRRLARAQRGVPRRRDHRHARGGPRAARPGGLLRPADGRLQRQPEDRRGRAHRPRLRGLADLRLREARRRDLHEGRRRGSGHRRQDRGRDPRGRPPQPGRDRRQRRRQRRRLRGDGGGPVRDLRRHRRGGDAARHPHLPPGDESRALPARARRRRDHRVDHRDLRRALASRQRRAGALPGADRLGRDRRRRVRADHLLADERPHAAHRDVGGAVGATRRVGQVLPLRADRHRRHGAAVRDHRLLHLDALLAGQEDRQSVDHGPRDEHHPGLRLGPAGDRPAGARAGARHPRCVEARRRRHGGHLRRRRRGDGPALAHGPDRRARRVRSDHRQRRRDRGDGRSARGGPQRDRPAGRGRQHDQGRHEGLRDRLGGARGRRAVRGLPQRTGDPHARDHVRDQRTARS